MHRNKGGAKHLATAAALNAVHLGERRKPRTGLLLPCLALLAGSCGTNPTVVQDVPTAVPVDSSALRLTELGQRITSAPNDAALYAERAALLLARDSVMPAMNDLVRAVSMDSSNANYRVRLGELFWFTKTVDQAKYQFEKALEFDPRNTTAMLKLAEIQLVLRQYQKSLDLTNEALRIDSRLAKGYFIKGWVHKETGDTAKAISSYFTAVEMDPQYYDAVMQLARLHERRGDPLALEFYNTAIEISPKSSEALYNRGMYCQERGMDSLAIASYARIKEHDPGNAMAFYNTGWIRLEHLKEPRAAVGEFSAAIQRLPTYHQAYYNRGLAYEDLQLLDSAVLDYRRALAIQPDYDLAAQGLQRMANKGVRAVP